MTGVKAVQMRWPSHKTVHGKTSCPPARPPTLCPSLQDVTLTWGQKKGYIIPQARIVVSKLFSPFLAQYLCTNVSHYSQCMHAGWTGEACVVLLLPGRTMRVSSI